MSRLATQALLALYLLLFPSPIHAQVPTTTKDASIIAETSNREQGSYIDISIDSGSSPINAVDLKMSFDPAKNRIQSIELKDSFCQIFIRSDYSNTKGSADITCGLPTPGLSGRAKLARIHFEGVDDTENFQVSTASQILANDGFGTPVLREIIKSYSR